MCSTECALQQQILYLSINLVWQYLLDLASLYICDLFCPTLNAPCCCSTQRGVLLSHLLAQLLSRLASSRWLDPQSGMSSFGAVMVYQGPFWLFAHLKTILFSCAGLGAPLNSGIEGVQCNEWMSELSILRLTSKCLHSKMSATSVWILGILVSHELWVLWLSHLIYTHLISLFCGIDVWYLTL